MLQKAAVIDSLPQAIQEEPVIRLGKEYKLIINEPKNTIAANTAVKNRLQDHYLPPFRVAVQMKTLRTSSCNANDCSTFSGTTVRNHGAMSILRNMREFGGLLSVTNDQKRPGVDNLCHFYRYTFLIELESRRLDK